MVSLEEVKKYFEFPAVVEVGILGSRGRGPLEALGSAFSGAWQAGCTQNQPQPLCRPIREPGHAFPQAACRVLSPSTQPAKALKIGRLLPFEVACV